MHFDDIVDPVTVRRIERDHDACVIDDAFEIHVADRGSTSFLQAIAAYSEGTPIVVHLVRSEAVRGRLREALVEWLAVECSGHQMLIAHRAIVRTHITAATGRKFSPARSRTFGSLLREHQVTGRAVRLRLADESALWARIAVVGADYVAMDDGSWVPFASIDVCELH